MKKIILTLLIIIMSAASVFAAKIPDGVQNSIKKDFPKAEFRFDGLIILPDGTLYLPLYPALVKKPEKIEIKNTYPEGKTISDEPDIIIYNNDFALLKIFTDSKGRKTVINLQNPPIEVKTGLLPQDMLVPKELIVPDNIKGIIGNLQIATAQDAGLKVKATPFAIVKNAKISKFDKNLVSRVPQLENKTIYVTTCYSKNIQVIEGESSKSAYALTQKSIPIDIKATPDGLFLLVSTFAKTSIDVISLTDERVIKQIDLTTPANEIVIDKKNNKAFVSSPDVSSIYVIDLKDMTLKQKIKVKGMCEKLYLSEDSSKLFYADKKTNDIWVIELSNNFIIKNIGNFPNVSKITYNQNKVYVASRTKNRLAIVDYVTLSLLNEIAVNEKPIDMILYKNNLFVLSAQKNSLQVVNTEDDKIINTIDLNTNGFSTKICPIKNTPVVLVMDTKAGKYSVVDLNKKEVIKTNILEVPVSTAAIVERVRKIK